MASADGAAIAHETCLLSFCAAWTVAGLVCLATVPAVADRAFREQFRAKYIKPASKDPKDIALRAAFDDAGCNLCHVGEDRANRNAYGAALAKLLSRETDAGNKEKIQAALDKVAAMKSKPEDPNSPTFGEIIASGKLPADDSAVRVASSPTAGQVLFNRDIRPILAENCFRLPRAGQRRAQGRSAAGPARGGASRPGRSCRASRTRAS